VLRIPRDRRPVLATAAALFAVAAVALGVSRATEPAAARETSPEPIRFGRDVRPILSDRCFLCHGPDRAKRQAGLRLDLRDEAIARRDGRAAIVPGDPEASEIVRRMVATDPDVLMPPPDSGKHALSPHELETVRNWIAAGAAYEPHWAFVAPVRHEPPAGHASWSRDPIDSFIAARLASAGLEPSLEAAPETLARRAFLDLTGLPPTPEELTEFLSDWNAERAGGATPAGPDAYDRLVDRLLTTEPYRSRYAERMAVPWLDLARYADTSGIHMDAGRSIWPYRDWVLGAFRDRMPFDRFVIEQLAGDLLPGATDDQKIASGFHRNHVTSDEGGAIDAEYRLEYAADRVATTGAAFLGLTLHCARCHDHKFDPVTAEDYYSLIAFFNSIEEPGIYSQVPDSQRALEPFLVAMRPEQKAAIAGCDARIAALREERDRPTPEEAAARAGFESSLRGEQGFRWAHARIESATSAGGATLVALDDGSVLASGANPDFDEHVLTLETYARDLRAIALEALTDPSLPNGGVGRAPNGNAVLEGIELEVAPRAAPGRFEKVPLVWGWADVEQTDGDYRLANALVPGNGRGWAVGSHVSPGSRATIFLTGRPFGFEGGTFVRVRLKYRSPYARHVFGRVRLTLGAAAADLLARLPETRSNWYIVGPFPASDAATAYATAYGPEKSSHLDLAARFGPDGTFTWRYAPGVVDGEPARLAEGLGSEYIAREIWSPDERDIEVALGSDDGLVVFLDGKEVHRNETSRALVPDSDRIRLKLSPGRHTLVAKVVNTGGQGAFSFRSTPRDGTLAAETLAFALPAGASPEAIARADAAWRGSHSPRYRDLNGRIAAIEGEKAAIEARIPRTMVMKELPMPRETFVHERGLYDKANPERRVTREVPAVLGALPADAPRDRLGLARWLVSEDNPLLARVTVNRLWAEFFGNGIVRTVEDFGLQGEWPSHPELLDTLAVDFREGGWDLDALIRRIATSATYRQEARVRPEAEAIDPDRRLLGFFPRQRLGAEQLRDQALFVGGLLVEEFGGPSVKPYQPAGLWEEVAMPQSNTRTYGQGTGDDLWRRSVYTYWKRAAPPPSMLALDAPTREYCVTRRLVTNTPLQALVLWNDPQFVEAARGLATRTLGTPGTDAERIAELHRRCTGEPPTPDAAVALAEALAAYRERFGAAPDDAERLLSVGASPRPPELPAAELASWTMLGNAVLASDRTIVKD
jgi:hypothetical protein